MFFSILISLTAFFVVIEDASCLVLSFLMSGKLKLKQWGRDVSACKETWLMRRF